jgi:hypothetical protein
VQTIGIKKNMSVKASIKSALIFELKTLSAKYLMKESGKFCSPNWVLICHCQSVIGQ